MMLYLITFRSVTFAQRGERALRQAGINCELQRTPRWMEEKGCGYSLGVKEVLRALEVLRNQKVPLRKVYRRRPDGSPEEVRL
jgi:hypothetical protein